MTQPVKHGISPKRTARTVTARRRATQTGAIGYGKGDKGAAQQAERDIIIAAIAGTLIPDAPIQFSGAEISFSEPYSQAEIARHRPDMDYFGEGNKGAGTPPFSEPSEEETKKPGLRDRLRRTWAI
jgi:hypothetical protein